MSLQNETGYIMKQRTTEIEHLRSKIQCTSEKQQLSGKLGKMAQARLGADYKNSI